MRQAPHMGTKGLTIAATITLGVLTTTSAALGIPALIEVSHTAKAEKTAESSTSPEAPGDAPGGAEGTTPPAEAAPPADQPIQTPAEPSSPDDENTPPGETASPDDGAGETSSPDKGTSENEQPETPSDDKNGDTENTPPKKSESGKKTEPDTQESSDCNCKKHRTHVVQEHDTLSSISTQYGVSVDAIMKANKLRDADMIYTGSTLRIPD